MRCIRTSAWKRTVRNRDGFGLIVIAALFTAFSVIATVAIDRDIVTNQVRTQSAQQGKMALLSAALVKYAQSEGSLPCPALDNLPTTDNNFGVPASCTSGTLPSGITQLGSSEMIRGMVPLSALQRYANVRLDDVFDEQGSRIMYVVNRNLTNNVTPALNLAKDFALVQDLVTGTPPMTADFVLISYGRDKIGAIPRNGTTATIACNTLAYVGSNSAENCDTDTSFIKLPLNTSEDAEISGASLSQTYFDDDVIAVRITCPNGTISRQSDGQCTNAFCWGDNTNGQIGNGTTTSATTPQPVLLPAATAGNAVRGFQAISTSSDGTWLLTCGISTTVAENGAQLPFGDLYCWGTSFGNTPTKVTLPSGTFLSTFKFTAVKVGHTSSCAVGGTPSTPPDSRGVYSTGTTLNPDEHIYCWGYNGTDGRLGNSPIGGAVASDSMTTPVRVTRPTGVVGFKGPDSDPNSWFSGDGMHWCAIGHDLSPIPKLYCWGTGGSDRMLGDDTAASVSFFPKEATSVTTEVGSVLVSGTPDTIYSVGSGGSSVFTNGGRLVTWGGTTTPTITRWGHPAASTEPLPASGHFNANEHTRGANVTHQCVSLDDGTAYCKGANTYGQLGNGTTVPTTSFGLVSSSVGFKELSIGNSTSCGLRIDGKAYCWGRNDVGQLGDSTIVDRNVPTPVTLPKGVNSFTKIVAGSHTSCALTPP